MNTHTYGRLEVTGSSKESIEDAIRNAIAKVGTTVPNLRWFEMTEVRGMIDQQQVAYWQVSVKVGYDMA